MDEKGLVSLPEINLESAFVFCYSHLTVASVTVFRVTCYIDKPRFAYFPATCLHFSFQMCFQLHVLASSALRICSSRPSRSNCRLSVSIQPECQHCILGVAQAVYMLLF